VAVTQSKPIPSSAVNGIGSVEPQLRLSVGDRVFASSRGALNVTQTIWRCCRFTRYPSGGVLPFVYENRSSGASKIVRWVGNLGNKNL